MSETNTPVPTSPGASPGACWHCCRWPPPSASNRWSPATNPSPRLQSRPGSPSTSTWSISDGVSPPGRTPRFFAFTNTGSTPVRVPPHPSCGCLDPKLPKATWEPGERAGFSLRSWPPATPGPKEYTVRVEYDDGKPGRPCCAEGEPARAETGLSPKALIFYQNTPDPITRPITLSRHHIKRLSVLDVSTSSSIVQAAIGRDRIDANGQRTAEVLVTVGAVPPGKHQAFVEIATDDPDYPEVRVPVLVMGPAAAKSAARNAEKKR
ncbi:MAG: hypothetical protein CM1200mP2_03490 [Planctomycetaceae bacterium]|nr:MAG: hypothetical protein CM1200mP2_03490 [Planctomycetaceae bacterium]